MDALRLAPSIKSRPKLPYRQRSPKAKRKPAKRVHEERSLNESEVRPPWPAPPFAKLADVWP